MESQNVQGGNGGGENDIQPFDQEKRKRVVGEG